MVDEQLIRRQAGASMRAIMGWVALGDRAWLMEAAADGFDARPGGHAAMARRIALERIPGVCDVVASYDSIAVHFMNPLDGGRVLARLETAARDVESAAVGQSGVLTVPVAYGGADGPDLADAACALGMPQEEIVRLHSGGSYTVAAVGFSPGFPYLSGLPECLRLPRRASPRRVAAGSVAIAGNQAGIYPTDSHGGWHVIGRTALEMFDPLRAEPALLKPGDRLRFTPGAATAVTKARCEVPTPTAGRVMEIIEPGMLTTIQDIGRPGHQHIGVSPGGAADPFMARVANLLVGNPPDAALLECCMQGPVLRVPQGSRVAWVGWDDMESGKPQEISNSRVLDMRGRMAVPHGYFAIAGGIDVPRVLGSRATDLRAGFGGWHGRPLLAGDLLPLGMAGGGPRGGDWRVGWPVMPTPGGGIELRFLRGVQSDWFTDGALDAFRGSSYRTTTRADRTGARLDGPRLELSHPREMVSQPVAAGSVQVPPDGLPIVLMSERQTIGGYPQIGHVISADLPLLARAWPGTDLRFREVSLDEARAAWRALQQEIAMLQTGLRMLE